jgi:hypothetical protein
MFKPLILAAAMAVAPLAQAVSAVTYNAWDLNRSATLLQAGTKIQLTGQQGDVGTAWAPGTLDLSGFGVGDVLEIAFDFRATAGGDAMGVVLDSGGVAAQSPSAFLGLDGLHSGVLAAFNPGLGKGGAVVFSSTSVLPSNLGSFTGPFDASVITLGEPAHAVFRLARTSQSWDWSSQLVVSPPGGEDETAVAYAFGTEKPFDDLSHVRFGFIASAKGTAATFEVFNVSSPVPESASGAMALAGLLVVGAAMRRRVE